MTADNFISKLRAASRLKDLPINPVANMLRRHNADEFEALKASIRLVGVTNPLGIDADGRLVDGRHRCQAVIELRAAGVEVADPPINTITCSPADYVLAAVCGRQMSKGQLAHLVVRICQNSDTTLSEAADRYGVSRQSLNQIKQLMDASPNLAERVASGELTLNKAVTIAENGVARAALIELEQEQEEIKREAEESAQQAQDMASTDPGAVARGIHKTIDNEFAIDAAVTNGAAQRGYGDVFDAAWWATTHDYYARWRKAVPDIAAIMAASNAQRCQNSDSEVPAG
jgi:ParB-like chromosome segregation protein Spo0J